ncbi:MAG TPA: endonuclease/exonuclease/phosphatase family protein [Patescibacteria group bacterium]|nr:endonuclease/exonuclease/phosphatase family protein [Patescibacteria group bacterium]
MTLRFLSFNLHGGRSLDGKRDLTRIHDLMERLNIDIGVFQEMETRPSAGGAVDGVAQLSGAARPHHFPGPSMNDEKGWYGNLIVSRYEITRGLFHNLETKPDLEPRNAIDAVIATPYGKIRVIGTHLSLSLFERQSEARNLMRLMDSVEDSEKLPLFLMGDINEWQWRAKLLRHLDSLMTPLPCRATFPSFLPVLRLDRAWHRAPGFKMTAHRIDGPEVRHLSDHLPIVLQATPA